MIELKFNLYIVSLGGQTQESNKISQGRVEGIKITGTYRQTTGKGKYRIDIRTELHAYKKEQNKKSTFIWISILYKTYSSNQS